MLVPLILLGFTNLHAQERTLTGTIVDADNGEPLIGANVFVEGTQTGTITDFDGNFSLLADGAVTLVITYIGYDQKRVEVAANVNNVDISLSQGVGLDEVVVTALGLEQDRRSIVSSTQSVGSDELLASREISVVDAISQKVAGVSVNRQGGAAGASSSIVIRGMSSISGENQPLFVIDGVPINNSFRTTSRASNVDVSNRAIDINPNDIESISVLKGSAATAIYGLQAGSGAIIITTKKGTRSDVAYLNVDYNIRYSMDPIMNYFPAQMRYAQGDNNLYGNTTFSHFGPPLTTLRYDGSDLNPTDPRGRIVDMNDPSAIADARLTPVDNQEIFFQTGTTLENNLSITSGNQMGSFRLSIGHTTQEGIIPNNTFERTSIRLTGETSLADNVRVSASANYINSEGVRFGRGNNFSDVIQGTIRTPPSFDNSAGFVLPNGDQRSYRYNPANPDGFGPDNPYWVINNNPFNDRVDRLIGYVQAMYDPLPWLNIMYRIGTDVSSDKRNQIWAVGSRGGDGTLGRVQEDTWNDYSLNSDFTIMARRNFGSIGTTFLVGHNYFKTETRRQFFDGRELAIPGLYNINNAQSSLNQIQFRSQKETTAAFGRINLDYDRWLYVEFTGRNEWTSTLLSPNNSFFYGSAGVGIIVSDLFNFDPSVLSFAKIKTSYAQAGRDADPYTNATFYNRGSTSGVWGGGVNFPLAGSGLGGVSLSNTAGNPTLKPERNETFEIGVELGFLNDRITLDATYYNSLDKDQIIPVSVAGSTGFTNRFINAGEIENEGIELFLIAQLIAREDFGWRLGVNYSRNRNNVLSLPVERIPLGGFGNVRPQIIEGEPYSVFYGTGFKRNENGDLLLTDAGLPQIDGSGDLRLGDPNPDFLLGLSNSFSYGNFNLSFLWDFKIGGDVAHVSTNWQRAQGVPDFTYDRGHMVIFEGIKESDGTPNTTPVILDQTYYTVNAGGRNIAERFIEDGSWVRLRDVNLTYTLPSDMLDRIFISRLDITLFARNALLFTGYSGIDPETNLYGPNNSLGIDAFGTPNTRSFGVSLNLSL